MRFRWFKAGIGVLAVCVSVPMLTAAPATAARHRHNRHHHAGGTGGSSPTCGPGTSSVGGVCTPTPSSPTSSSNVVISPSDVTMDLSGGFFASVVVSGLPPNIGVKANNNTGSLAGGTPCGKNGKITEVIFPFSVGAPTTDSTGKIQYFLQAVDDGFGHAHTVSCVPGTYPITFSEAASPFQTFIGFVTLHF